MIPFNEFEQQILDLIKRATMTTTLGALQNQRLVFGGIRGSGGGEGGPIMPFIGKIRQTDVTFDTDEFAVITIPSGEDASLLDNLNRIRAGVTIKPLYTPTCYSVPPSGTLLEHLQGIDNVLCSGTGGGGWPFSHVLTVDLTDPNADYSTITAAVAGAIAGDTILVGTGTYACDNVTLPAGVNLVGVDKDACILQTTTEWLALYVSDACFIANLTVKNLYVGPGGCFAIRTVPGATAEFRDVRAEASGGDPANAFFIGGYSRLINCEGIAYSATGWSYGAESFDTITIEGGYYSATFELGGGGFDIYAGAFPGDSTLLSRGPLLANNTVDTSRPLYGWYYDSSGLLHNLTDAALYMDERAAKPAQPIANSWVTYFKSDGMYYEDDAGVETGPLGVGGGGGWPFTGKVNTVDTADPDADFASVVLAIAGITDGDTILLSSESYAEANLILNITAALIGWAAKRSVIASSGSGSNASILTLAGGKTYSLKDIRLQHDNNTATNNTACLAVQNGNITAVVENIEMDALNANPGVACHGALFAASTGGKVITFRDCVFTSNGSVGAYALWIAGTDAITIVLENCLLNGDLLLNNANARLKFVGDSRITGTVTFTAYVQVYGHYFDDSGNLVVADIGGGVPSIKGKGSNVPTLGTTTAAEKWGHIYQAPARDVFPDDDRFGLAKRLITHNYTVTGANHFRTGIIPTGYAWAGAPFATPGTIAWNLWGDYGQFYPGGGVRSFLWIAGAVIGDFELFRVITETLSDGGYRIDDGTDNNYYEWRLVHVAGAAVVLRMRQRTGGGGVTVTDVTTYPVAFPFVLALLAYNTGGGTHTPYGYINSETRSNLLVTAGANVNWVPSRKGLVMDGAGGSDFDWFSS